MKRFIAGAVCPECRELDRLVLEIRTGPGGDQEWQRCVACTYEAQKPQVNPAHTGIPRGKPERRVQTAREIASQTVKIMDLQGKMDPQDELK